MMVVFWGGLAAVVIIGVRAFGGNPRRASGETETPDAKAILEARFARGEISQEEFEDRRRVLGLVGVNGRYNRKVAGVRQA